MSSPQNTDSMLFLLNSLSRLSARYINEELRRFSISDKRACILRELQNHPDRSMAEHASALNFHRTTMLRYFTALEGEGLVQSQKIIHAKRARVAHRLTAVGAQLLKKVDVVTNEALGKIAEALGDDYDAILRHARKAIVKYKRLLLTTV